MKFSLSQALVGKKGNPAVEAGESETNDKTRNMCYFVYY